MESIVMDKIFDWASEKGPSEHIKFDRLFQICYIITKDLNKELIDMTFLPSMNNLTTTFYNSQNMNVLYRTQDDKAFMPT